MVFCVCLSPPIMSLPTFYVCPHLLCLSPPIMSVPTYYVCLHLLRLSPPFMSVPTYYVCPHLLCLSPLIMSVPIFYVCPHLLCLSPPIMSVPTHNFFADKPFLNLECSTSSPACLLLLSSSYLIHMSAISSRILMLQKDIVGPLS